MKAQLTEITQSLHDTIAYNYCNEPTVDSCHNLAAFCDLLTHQMELAGLPELRSSVAIAVSVTKAYQHLEDAKREFGDAKHICTLGEEFSDLAWCHKDSGIVKLRTLCAMLKIIANKVD